MFAGRFVRNIVDVMRQEYVHMLDISVQREDTFRGFTVTSTTHVCTVATLILWVIGK
jgi:hypothetical protein